MSYTYIASPYSHSDPSVVTARHAVVLAYTAHLLHNRKTVFSPIVHCHEIAQLASIRGDFAFWKKYNNTMLASSSKLLVLQLPGWTESLGVLQEIAFAEGKGIPVKYCSSEDIRDIVVRYPGINEHWHMLVAEITTRFNSLQNQRKPGVNINPFGPAGGFPQKDAAKEFEDEMGESMMEDIKKISKK